MRSLLLLLIPMVVSYRSELRAQTSVTWQSEVIGPEDSLVNRQSDGVTPLDGDFEFLLGSFTGLVPGPGNLNEWEESFQAFGSALYSEDNGRFFQTGSLASNAPPFTTSTRVYIWGRNGTEPGSEWLLFGQSGWFWPVAQSGGGPPPFPKLFQITADTEEDAVFGTVSEGGFLLRTAVADFEITYGQWGAKVFDPGDASGVDLDFDADGRSNFLEYALGSDPKSPDEPFRVSLGGNFEIEIPRARGRQVDWELQGSDDLKDFAALTGGFELAVEEADRLVFRITDLSSLQRFFRVKAVPAGN